jgi:hypothetical protein
VTVLRHAKKRTRAMTVAPRVGLVGLLGQGNLGNDGSLEAVLACLGAEHPHAILDFLCTGTHQMMARYDVPATRLRWYNTQNQRAPGMTTFAAKSLMVPLGMIVNTSGDAVYPDLAFALPTPRDVPVVAGMVGVDRLIEQFTELESRSTQLQQMIMERTAANVRLLNHQFATLSALLFRSAEPEEAGPKTSVLA